MILSAGIQGCWIADHAGLTLLLCLAGIALLCLGLLRLQVETDPQTLWVRPASQAAREKASYEVSESG